MKNDSRISGLYGILNVGPASDIARCFDHAACALQGGCRILQLRCKGVASEDRLSIARALRDVTREYHATFLINDDVDLALNCAADGVHVGQQDTPLVRCRAILGPNALIGVSCHSSLALAQDATLKGANYVAFGRFFPSRTKPDAPPADLSILRQAARTLPVPLVAIGGINPENAPQVIEAGADAIAVIDSLFGDADITTNAMRLASLFNEPGTRQA